MTFSINVFFIFSVSASEPPQTIKFGIMLPASDTRIHEKWQPFINYLSHETGYKVEIIVPRGLNAVKSMLKSKELDFVFLNSYAYYVIKEQLNPFAQMNNISNTIYSKGRYLVRTDGNIKKIEDLKGKKIALVSRVGAASYLAPRAQLRKLHINIDNDLQITFTKDLKKATYMLLHDKVDVAVMCSVNYKILTKKLDMRELTILDETETVVEPVISARIGIDPEVLKNVSDVILFPKDKTKYQEIIEPLKDFKVLSFVPYDINNEIITVKRMQESEF